MCVPDRASSATRVFRYNDVLLFRIATKILSLAYENVRLRYALFDPVNVRCTIYPAHSAYEPDLRPLYFVCRYAFEPSGCPSGNDSM